MNNLFERLKRKMFQRFGARLDTFLGNARQTVGRGFQQLGRLLLDEPPQTQPPTQPQQPFEEVRVEEEEVEEDPFEEVKEPDSNELSGNFSIWMSDKPFQFIRSKLDRGELISFDFLRNKSSSIMRAEVKPPVMSSSAELDDWINDVFDPWKETLHGEDDEEYDVKFFLVRVDYHE